MANTTNFGWETPDDTDLVKDGAAAMRTLGNAIDASLVDLKGGTTGQVLSKNTNTDMDFVWTTPQTGDITAVTAGTGLSGGGTSGDVTLTNTVATTFDAKGDLVVGTGADTFAKLVAGSNGDTLVADSSTSTGLRWQSPVQGNVVLNSAFQIWQRGTSISQTASTTPYTADRWQAYNGANQANTISRQSTNDTTNLPFIQYCARFQRNSGQTGTADTGLFTSFETINSIPYAGKTIVISFYARAGANFSAVSNAFVSRVYGGTGTDQNILSGYTGSAVLASQTNTLTTTWQRFSMVANVTATTTEMALGFYYPPSGTAGTNDYFEITGVQLEIGSVATPFRTYAATLAGELAACQRYYWRASHTDQIVIGSGYAQSATVAIGNIANPVPMRVIPTSVDFSNVQFQNFSGTEYALSAITLDPSSTTCSSFYATMAGATAGHTGRIKTVDNLTGFLGFSAEL